MKRNFVWMPVAIVTFLLGIAILLVPEFNSGLSDRVVHIEPIRVADHVECESSKIFPGRSVPIADLPKGASGYFPRGMYAYGWQDRESFLNEWYGKHLKAMREPSLLKESRSETEVYRFLWLRSFHNPIAVRVDRNGSNVNLVVKKLSGAGGYDPGKLIVSKNLRLDQGQWCEFMGMLERAKYWNEPLDDANGAHIDGAQWILEGVREGRYHAVDRWTPDDGAFREACVYLLELGGVETDKLGDELY